MPMPYFIRRYEKGVKNSGCQDVIVSEAQIPIETFVNLAHATGPGKYILGKRGKGIRGFNKITDCVVEPQEAPMGRRYLYYLRCRRFHFC
jgi:hypothetical protein